MEYADEFCEALDLSFTNLARIDLRKIRVGDWSTSDGLPTMQRS